jgi:L-asparaginase II
MMSARADMARSTEMTLIGDRAAAHVEVCRGDLVESRHRISAAVVHASDGLIASAGDPGLVVYARSAIKPIQALPLIADGVAARFGFRPDELALACGSHSGEPFHIAAAGRMLQKLGIGEDALACGPHAPLDERAANELRRLGVEPGRLHNNCSGKHAGMLALARAHDWPLQGYHERHHPVQRRMADELSRWSRVPVERLHVAVDGCGVATFALPLHALATAFARLGRAVRTGEEAPAALVGAMTAHPEMVGGTNRLCTDLMRVTGGRIFAKVGAEGVYCAGAPAGDVGIAVKVEDGGRRAVGPALIAVLEQLGLVDATTTATLRHHAERPIRNTRGEPVGAVRVRFRLEMHG